MEDGGGEEYKSRILNVKPLRCLAPIFTPAPSFPLFPHPQAASPFKCAPTGGPFQSGFAPFYPYAGYPDTHNVKRMGMPEGVREIRAAPKRKKSQKRTWAGGSQDVNIASSDADIDGVVDKIVESFNLLDFDTFRRAGGDTEAVGYIRLIYDVLRRKFSQIEDAKESAPGATRQCDLRAGTILLNKGIRTNVKKRIGVVPGVEIGDIFFFRMEMCLIGLHAPIMAGIDYMGLKISQGEEPVAVSIVLSGGYEDNSEDGDLLFCSGQGGNVNNRGMEITDQKLERGNLALEKSLHRGNEESWVDKGKSGCNVFKYKLVRLSGQTEAYTVWKSVQQWKDGSAARVGLILQDLAFGAESMPVSLVNDVDDEKGPANFTYYPGLRYSKPVNSNESSTGCDCHGGCLASISNCPCIQRNVGHLPYTTNGVLVSQKALIHECGSSCMCPPNCKNRVCQSGLKVRLEVFKTKDKGWGLRSWDPIRSGAFICEYAGEVIDISRAEELGGVMMIIFLMQPLLVSRGRVSWVYDSRALFLPC
ncbi:Histone-lysine N-methyltransferase, H3 lysine-9 specific SUVH1 [Hibiscus syriacus]|uniref:Histone-lysine N-methyltransferase, H3 lysine-9 specific SUVH1 n=1 Tax=Hibiscus syriacus TaxID=106335 RepID=A0A6A2XYL7_HIBSY|nr:Histone-lysine N-methyltransferase, H3 lysine-9 specific SUVH1 [Hibiscus syriacus]